MAEEEKFNVIVYMFKMFVCSYIWVFVIICTLYIFPSMPHKLIEINFGRDYYSFELSILIAFLIVFFAQHFMLAKWVFPYTFQTNCKNPIVCLFLNIAFGGFIVLSFTEFIEFEAISPDFTAKTFIIMAIINYFLFYAKNGYEYREKEYIENWQKSVYRSNNSSDDNK